MPSILLTPPASEPLTLAEAKNYLRVEHSDDDTLIAALIAAARLAVEQAAGLALITQQWRLVQDIWPESGRIVLRPAPAATLAAVRVFDAQNNPHALDLQAFVLNHAESAIAFARWSLAAPGRAHAGIEIDFTAGYGASASDVPEPLRQAIRMLTAHWYENRGAAAASSASPLPLSVTALIAPYRQVSL